MITKKHITAAALIAAVSFGISARDAKGLKVYINPGHGGYESNDRNVVIEPYKSGDPAGYWESKSNLSKGLQLRDMLQAKGYAVVMSRVNNTEDDDLGLSTIVRLSNESKADIFFSIHSNATGTSARRNFPLMLYRGYDNEPVKPKDLTVCQILNKYLLQNQATYWTSTSPNCRGDWSFYKSWGTSGLGVLRGNNITAMLSEGSFHDYIPEAYRLMNDDFCWVEAWHFRKTVDEFFGVDGLSVGAIAGRLNDTRVPRDGDYLKYGDDLLATIQGATVELLDAEGKVLSTYKTDEVDINGFYLFKDLQPGKYKIHATEPTHIEVYSEEIVVTADEISFCNLQMARERNTPPVVESYSPVWKDGDEGVLCNTPIVVQFNWDMDMPSTEAAFSIDPAVPGVFSWEDLNYRMIFTPTEPYSTSTKYTVTIGTGAKHAGDINLEAPVSFSFFTSDRNFMTTLGSFPKEGEKVHYQNASIEFRFDKLPNTSSLLSQLKCTDSQGNTVAFNNRGKKTSKVGDPYGYFRIPFSKDLVAGETYNLHLDGSFGDKDGITINGPVDVKFVAVDAGDEKPEMEEYDAIDDATRFAFDNDGSTNVESASVTSAKDNLYGTQATSFTYNYSSEENGDVRYSLATESTADMINDGDIIGVHVFGDLTGNNFYIEHTSDVSVLPQHVCSLDFLGWRYIEVPVHTEGASTITGVKVGQVPSQMSRSGNVKLDRILKKKGAGVEDAYISSVAVYPNPASEYVIANAGCTIERVELVGLNGATVAANGGNVLNVSDVTDGTYIVLVYTASGRTAHKISIKH